MKKIIYVALAALALTGCQSHEIQEVAESIHTNRDNYTGGVELRETSPYYNTSEVKNAAVAQITEFINKYSDEAISCYSEIGLGTAELNLRVRGGEENQLIKLAPEALVNHEVVQLLEQTLTPGIKDFVEEAFAQGGVPQVKIIDNQAIIVYPYGADEGLFNGRALIKVLLKTSELVDPLFMNLWNQVNQDQFVVKKPYIGPDSEMLEITTPTFALGSYDMGTITGAGLVPRINYQFRTKEDKLEQLRVVVKRMITNEGQEAIDSSYFEPLTVWLENEWGMNAEGLNQVAALTQNFVESKKGKVEGDIGDIHYRYALEDESITMYGQTDQVMTLLFTKN